MLPGVVRSGAVIAAFVALGLSQDPGCGGGGDPPRGPNAPCTRQKDCSAGLVCAEGVCTEPDSGVTDAGSPDADDDGG
jgi:hypothetical protein